jgi:protein SCO1/2
MVIAVGALVVLAGIVSARSLALWAMADAGPPSRRQMFREAHLPNLVLTDHIGRRLRFYDDLVRDKVVAINFMYTSCSRSCGLSSQNISSLQDALGLRLGSDVMLYSISIDPEHDTPEALAAYRRQFAAQPGWSFFVPANAEDAIELRRKLGVYDPDPVADGDFATHTGMVVLGNEPAARWSMVPSLVNPVRLRQAIERILLPPDQRRNGAAVVEELPREDSHTSQVLNGG